MGQLSRQLRLLWPHPSVRFTAPVKMEENHKTLNLRCAIQNCLLPSNLNKVQLKVLSARGPSPGVTVGNRPQMHTRAY